MYVLVSHVPTKLFGHHLICMQVVFNSTLFKLKQEKDVKKQDLDANHNIDGKFDTEITQYSTRDRSHSIEPLHTTAV